MNDVLPLLAASGAVAYAAWHRRPSRRLHADLCTAIAAQARAHLADAGNASLFAVAGALALPGHRHQDVDRPLPAKAGREHEPAWAISEIIRPLGLQLTELMEVERHGKGGAPPVVRGKTAICGERYGRAVVVELHDAHSEIRVQEALMPFQIAAREQIWEGLDGAPLEVRDALGALEPHRRWDGLKVVAGPDGLVLRRELESARSWMHDLWLAELLADRSLDGRSALA